MNIDVLKGLTLESISVNRSEDEIRFITSDGRRFMMYHPQDCCEVVGIEEIIGDLRDLTGAPILEAEEASNSDDPAPGDYMPESYTWTFYKLGTIKGHVTLRWFGSSNGYYGESVYFREFDGKESWWQPAW